MEKRLKKSRGKIRHKIQRTITVALFMLLTAFSVFSLSVFAASESDVTAPLSPTVILPVSVQVTGVNLFPPETYCIRLTSLDHAPLPELGGDSPAVFDADYTDITITGSGTTNFPPISYATAGVYRYTISQIAGNHPKAYYDPSVYAVTVTVTYSAGNDLTTMVALLKDGKKQDEAAFVNDYGFIPVLGDEDIPEADTPAEGPTEEPEDAPVDEAPDDKNLFVPTQPNDSSADTLLYTGQLNWPARLLACAGIILVVFGAILSGKKEKKRKDREG